MVESSSHPVLPIVDARWLRRHLDEHPDSTVICEVGSTMSGADPLTAFAAGHPPGARFVSLDAVLSAPPAGTAGRHPMPTPTTFARDLGALGIGDDAIVIAYDRSGGSLAGRLVWMLRIIGQRAALLDGGISSWPDRLESRSPSAAPVERRVREWPRSAIADAGDVVEHIAAGATVIDSRDPARYAGEVEPIDSVAGHVPGAINMAFVDNLAADSCFRPVDELAARFADVVDPIVYCGSGVTACHNALAIESAGFGLPRVYVGSWSGWSADPERPIAVGTDP